MYNKNRVSEALLKEKDFSFVWNIGDRFLILTIFEKPYIPYKDVLALSRRINVWIRDIKINYVYEGLYIAGLNIDTETQARTKKIFLEYMRDQKNQNINFGIRMFSLESSRKRMPCVNKSFTPVKKVGEYSMYYDNNILPIHLKADINPEILIGLLIKKYDLSDSDLESFLKLATKLSRNY